MIGCIAFSNLFSILHCNHQRKIRWLERDFNSHLRVSLGRAAVQKPEGASSNPARANEFFVGDCSVRLKTN